MQDRLRIQVWDLTLKMLGKKHKHLNAKGAETHGLMDFGVQLLEQHPVSYTHLTLPTIYSV